MDIISNSHLEPDAFGRRCASMFCLTRTSLQSRQRMRSLDLIFKGWLFHNAERTGAAAVIDIVAIAYEVVALV